jgi:hypothetical protein
VPMCNGQCPEGKVCGASATDRDGNAVQCSCQDETTLPCGNTAPECGGECPNGQECSAIAQDKRGNVTMCGCIKEASVSVSQ